MYKLIAIDLDGTLLNSYGEVNNETKQSINKAINKGIEIVLASGRPTNSIKTIAKEIGANKYLIAGNGAITYDIQKDKIIHQEYIKKDKVLEIIKLCEENNITYNIYTEKTILATELKYNVLYYYKENLKKEENKKTNIRIIENMYEYIKNMEEEKVIKITICENTKIIFKSIMKKLQKIKDIDILDVSHMSRKIIKQGTDEISIKYYYTEISSKRVNKWYAIENLIKQLKIKKEEVITIGDNINDLLMLEQAGLGVAMKGSAPAVIKISDYITESNNNNGVGQAIEKYI